MTKSLMSTVLTMLILASPLTSGADTRVYVRVGPPPAIAETRAVAPGPHHVWIAGYHRWDGQAYAWVPGRWDLPPTGYRTWVAGHWAHHHSNGYYWVEGHWRR
jgi:hypothetical protein